MKKLYLLLCLVFLAHPGWAAEPVKIGFLGPLTGPFSNVGTEAGQVMALLAADINEKGGLLGRKIEIVIEDEGEQPQTAITAARKLVQQGVVAVVGPNTSGMTASVQAVFNDGKIIQVSYGSTAISLTEKGLPYFFRTCPRDDEQAKAFVRIIRKLNIKKVALLHDQSLYGKGLAEAIDNQLDTWMMNTVYNGSLTAGRSDYLEVLQKMQATTPDAVFFARYYPEAARLLQGRLQLQWGIPFMGGDGVNHAGLVELAGIKAAKGFYFLSPPNSDDIDTPQTKRFLERFQKAYDRKPSSIYALLAGNAFVAVTESIMQVRTTEALAVSDFLHRRYFKKSGLTGEVFFNAWGDVVNDLYGIYRVDDNGRFILRKQLLHGNFIQ